ncbi:MAG: hypothetical protein WBV43_21620 [Pseudolabrys sp.]
MHPILPTGRHDLFFDENTALKITNSLVRNCCARESSTMVFRNMSDDDYVAIQKLRHPITRATVYLPAGQALPDTKTTLERDGLISCQYDEYGKCVSTIVHDPLSIRVLCWQLTVNAEAQHLGREPVFTNLLADLCENFSERARPDTARPHLPQCGGPCQRAEKI